MDIKDLNKTQLVMLTLLLSFVSSIATSIMTVSLMQQAPASVTVPINRVIQQTVEKIQQVEGKTVTQTVVVKEEDLVVDAIEKNQSALFSITEEVLDELGKKIEVSAGKGFVVGKEGLIVADANLAPAGGIYYAKNDSGKFKLEFVSTDKAGFSVLKIGAPLDEKSKIAYTVPFFGDIGKMKVGQKIILLGSGISSFVFEGNKDLKFSVSRAGAGGMLLNLDGQVLGIALYGETSSFAPSAAILEALKPAPLPKP